MKKEIFQRIHGYDESMRCLEDWDFELRVAKDYEIGFVPKVVMEATFSAGGYLPMYLGIIKAGAIC